ncbi:FAD-linked oxidase C-terminal domain-containing protein [Undibacterium fentianense]|uniref:FAD-binding protein n=1 Tax=Undibacterium fentianense TaxID=2828728 RepID=A0A941E1P6_9BURK|nr:FAD-linked oxidase C-terminal domain-containing protein [Undibacterium fentianense]MBR7799437.1 FAD-binding protein [Undibacterium fentianense]
MTRQTRHQAFILALKKGLPQHCVLSDEEELRPYECDSLSTYKQLPLAVVIPESESQIITILALCRQFQIAVVPRGAGTGLSGGATPVLDAIVLSTARLNKILALDPVGRVAHVQPGVRNLAISDSAAHVGLYYAPDPSSQLACSIGGNVAENAGGVHCLKYGLTAHNVLRVRVVMMDGEILELGSQSLDSRGLDLLGLFIGSEGLLGIVTEVTVKLLPKPQIAQVILASFETVTQAGNAVAQIIAEGIIPAGLEMMDNTSIRMVEPFVQAGYDQQAAAILLCESDGNAEEVAEEILRMSDVLQRAGASQLTVSSSDVERATIWSGRKNAFPAAGRISPDYYCVDGTIPRKYLAQVLEAIALMQDKYGMVCANVFHAGDGNLHPLILFDANHEGAFQRAEAFGAEILALCVQLGGTITGEHGVGIEKLDSMCVQFSDAELQTFMAIKQAFDPAQLLNPSKAIPSLHRCAEMGRMHVRAGLTRFPELPRF